MGVRIITDSASDMSIEEARQKDIIVLPLTITFDDCEFKDGVTITNEEFYERLEKKESFPKTSQVTPYEYEKEIKEAIAAGDEVVIITISSKVSGCYQSAKIALEHYIEHDKKDIYICDSMCICGSEYIMVELAYRLRKEGKSAKEIYEILEKKKDKARLATAFNTLEYLKLGGRLSNAKAFIGSLLDLKPIIKVEDGLITNVSKARGNKRANKKVRELVESFGKVDFSLPTSLAIAGKDDTNMMDFYEISKDILPPKEEIAFIKVGATVGAHCGPGAYAFSYFIKED